MSGVSASAVMELRRRTGIGMMECKQALVACDGDLEQAIGHLRKKGALKAQGKAGRVAAEGAVLGRVEDGGAFGVLVEVNSETDFVARDENFLRFAQAVLDAACKNRQANIDALVQGALEEQRQALVQKLGENIAVRRAALLEGGEGRVYCYVHNNRRMAALLTIRGGDDNLGRDLAMHVTAAAPKVVHPQDMPEEEVAREREILAAQAAASGKPAEIAEKMAAGRLQKFIAEHSLTQQPFVRDPKLSAGQLLQNAGAEALALVRFALGEGIVHEEKDFAAEAAVQSER